MSAPILVVGGGISGLYTANMLKRVLGREVVLFEKSDRFGGRALESNLDGVPVKLGAGIVRERDHRLISLAKALGTKITWMPGSPTVPRVLAATQALKERFELTRLRSDVSKLSFDQFLGPDKSIYGLFGRTDMMMEDVTRVFTVYGLEDIDGSSKPIGFLSWTNFVDALVAANRALGIPMYLNSTIDLKRAKQLCVVATTKKSTADLLPEVQAWPFYRMYVKIEGPWNERMPRLLQTGTPLQTVIEIDRSKGLLMAAYADGLNAVYWNELPMSERLRRARDLLVELGWDPSIRIVGSIDKFWAEGIHYVQAGQSQSFAAKISSMQGNLVFGGELTALVNQGWVEGALESAERVLSIVGDA
jgi:hypothetical protein